MMENKFNTFDLIKTTQNIPATLIIHYMEGYDEERQIILPNGSLLISNNITIDFESELSFLPSDEYQFESIRNIYLSNIARKAEILSYNYSINADHLFNHFEIVDPFHFNKLNPDIDSHIILLAYLCLNDRLNEISITRLLCFVYDIEALKDIKSYYENNLISCEDTYIFITAEIKRQLNRIMQ